MSDERYWRRVGNTPRRELLGSSVVDPLRESTFKCENPDLENSRSVSFWKWSSGRWFREWKRRWQRWQNLWINSERLVLSSCFPASCWLKRLKKPISQLSLISHFLGETRGKLASDFLFLSSAMMGKMQNYSTYSCTIPTCNCEFYSFFILFNFFKVIP